MQIARYLITKVWVCYSSALLKLTTSRLACPIGWKFPNNCRKTYFCQYFCYCESHLNDPEELIKNWVFVSSIWVCWFRKPLYQNFIYKNISTATEEYQYGIRQLSFQQTYSEIFKKLKRLRKHVWSFFSVKKSFFVVFGFDQFMRM